MRNIIIHYHIFKNAGSAVDEILRSSFGSRWQNLDKAPTPGVKILPFELQNFLEHTPHLNALSSHDAFLPVPVGNFTVYPIFFLRHPLLRARSAWKFEWQIQAGLTAPKGSFANYLQSKIENKEAGVFSDFQTYKLSNQVYKPIELNRRPCSSDELLQTAQTTVLSAPFFGIVEHMQMSLERMHFYLKVAFPELRVVNRVINSSTDTRKSTKDALDDILQEIGQDHYNDLVARNRLDLDLYQYALDRFFSIAPSI